MSVSLFMRPVYNRSWLFSLLVFALFAGSLTASLLAKQPLLWMDEILSYLLISDPSPGHLNNAIVSGLDANPPLFTNLYWLIGHAISMNVVFLRAISVMLFAAALALFYSYTTRITGRPVLNFFLITALAVFTQLNSTLATQIRAYPLFLLLTLSYFIVLHQLAHQPAKKQLLVAHTGLGLLVVFTHNFGLFYIAASGAFVGLLWLWSKNRAYWYALGTFPLIAAGWLLGWYPSFSIQAKAGEPHSWIPLPTVQSFFRIMGELAPTLSAKLEALDGLWLLPLLRFLGPLILFGFIAVPRLRQGFRAALADRAFTFYLLAMFIYLVTITITLVVSLAHTSVFISRYLWPNHLLLLYQLVYAGHYFIRPQATVDRIWQAATQRFAGYPFTKERTIRSGLVRLLPLYVAGIAGLLFYQGRKITLAPTTVMSYVDRLDKRYPVFLESSVNFMPVWFYSHGQRPVYFLLDRQSAFAPANDLGASVGYHTLQAVKTKYKVSEVRPLTSFRPDVVPHFYVVDEQWNYQIERFIQNKTVRVLHTMPTTMTGITIRECVFANALSAPSALASKGRFTQVRVRRADD